MRLRRVPFWFALLGALVARADTTLEERIRINQAATAVYRLVAGDNDGRSASGSAIHIGGGRFVTSCHITRNAKGIRIMRGAKYWNAYWQYKNVERDLCMVLTKEAPSEVARLGDASALRVGQKVFAVGFPAALTGRNIQYGTIQALYDFDGGKIIRTSAFFARGESGGALFDSEGKVVGVLTFKSNTGPGFNFAVPVSWINEVEEHAEKKPSAEDAVAFWEIDAPTPPTFLDAAALEAGDRWDELLTLATAWSQRAASDVEPLVAISKALYHTGREKEAIEPARKALALNPDHAETWYVLALIYHRLNDGVERDKSVSMLAKLCPERVEDLDFVSPRQRGDCPSEPGAASC